MADKKGITGLEFGSQISLLNVNLALRYHYRTGIWLSNIITGREFGSQISLPDKNWAFPFGNDNLCMYLASHQLVSQICRG